MLADASCPADGSKFGAGFKYANLSHLKMPGQRDPDAMV
jgi:hypothetical protein